MKEHLNLVDFTAIEHLFDERHPARALVGAVLGLSYDAIDQREDAVVWLERASEIESHFHVLSILAERHLQSGHITKSAVYAERMMAVNPDWRFQYHCALALIRCGGYQKARALLRDLIDRGLGGSIVHSTYVILFNEVDVILDTYPYNGMITSMEALWMGVPAVTLFERNGLNGWVYHC